MPVCILIVSSWLGSFGLICIHSARTVAEFGEPNRATFVDLHLTLGNRSADGRYDLKVDLEYFVQVNVSRQAVLSLLISGDGAFQVPTTNMQDVGESFVVFTGQNATADTYHLSTFQYTTKSLPLREDSAWAFPWDSYSSPRIYFWANSADNSTTYSQLRIVGDPPQGFVWNIEGVETVPASQVTDEMPILQRLFMSSPPEKVRPIAFRIALLRDYASFSTSAFYALAGIMIVWLAGGLARTGISRRERRVPALISMGIAALAFTWSFRQIAPPSPTVVESAVVFIAILWLVVEVKDVVREEDFILNLKALAQAADADNHAEVRNRSLFGAAKELPSRVSTLNKIYSMIQQYEGTLIMLFLAGAFLLSIRGQVTQIPEADVSLVLLRIGSLLVFLTFFAGFLGSIREVRWNWKTKERSVRYASNVWSAWIKGVQTFMLAFFVSSGMEELLRPYGLPVMSLEFGIVAVTCLVLYNLTTNKWTSLHVVVEHTIIALSIIVIFVNTFVTPPFTKPITIPPIDMMFVVAVAVVFDYALSWIIEQSETAWIAKRGLTKAK